MNLRLLRKSIGTIMVLMLVIASGIANAQVSITALPYSKSDNFNAYNPTTASNATATLPAGWATSGTSSYQGRGTGTSNSGGFYGFGSGSDFSAGALRSGSSAVYTYTVSFVNNSGVTITDLTLSWNYEQWRFSNTSGWNCTGTGALAANATLNGKDFAGAASGTAAASTPVASFTLSGLSIADGTSFGITWSTTDETGADNGVSIDDFTLSASGVVAQNQTITFGATAGKTYGDAAFAPGATASSGLTVSYASSNPNVATVSGSNINIVGAGTSVITASQAGNASFNAAATVQQTLTVAPKGLFFNNVSVANKIYDGNTAASFTGTLNGLVGADAVSYTAVANFNTEDVNNNIAVTVNATLTGAKAANYTLTQPSGLTANITAKPLIVVEAEADNKVQDGTNNAVITGTLEGVIAPDDVNFIGTGTFAQATPGNNIPVTSTATLGGADAANYALTQPTGLFANIYAQALTPQTISFGPVASAVYGDAPFTLNATATSNLTVTYESSNTAVATISGNTVTIVGVGTISITATQEGNGTFDEATPVVQEFVVLAKELNVLNAAATNKIYDGSISTTFTGTLSGVVGSDIVTLNGTANFASADVANGIAVMANGSLEGADADHYILVQPTALSANILPKAITANTTANNKVYDATTAASLNAITLNDVVSGDIVSASGTAVFVTKNVGNNIEVISNLILTGADAGNYSLAQPALSANIAPADLAVNGIAASDKVYDATTAATLSGVASVTALGSDVVSVTGSAVGTFINKNVGTAKQVIVSGLSLAGPDANNYSIVAPQGVTATITVASVTIDNAQAQQKTFDGTTAATITGTLNGVLGLDVVTLVGTGTFAQATAGTNIPVTATATLSGADAANYVINPQPTGLFATILTGPSILAPGDLSIIGFNVNAPDNFAFVAWVDLEANTYIKFTDNPFFSNPDANAANNVRGGEQFVMWRNNTGAIIPAGTVITIDQSPATNVGQIVSGGLDGLSGSGDNIFAYQGSATSGNFPDFTSNSNPTTFNGNLVFGLNTNTWLTNGTVNTNNSFLPSQLSAADANIDFGTNKTRGQYTGARNSQLTLAAYKALVTNPANWTTGTGSGTVALDNTAFTLVQGPSASELFGVGTICGDEPANLYVFVTDGLAPYTVVYTDGTSQYTANNYESGTSIIVNPAVTSTYTLVSVTDANGLPGTNNTGSATIEVLDTFAFYLDNDGDGFGTGNLIEVCAQDANTPPSGYASNNTDCDDTNNTVYQSGTLYVDFDGDGYSTNVSAVVCYGATTPAGYVAAPTLLDCNDNVAAINPGQTEILYNGVDDNCDGNLDEGFQLKTKLLAAFCSTTLTSISSVIGITTLAPAAAYTGWRVRATNGSQVQTIEVNVPHFQMTQFPSYAYATTYTIEIELQRNGVWLGYYGDACVVSTPAILAEGGAATVGSQCGTTLPKINALIATTSINGVTGYRFKVTNLTDPAGPFAEQIVTRGLNWFTLQMLTRYNYGTTYRIEVAVKTTGDFGGYGSPCEVSSPAAPALVNCGGIATSGTQTIAATSVQGVTQYRFQITRSSDGASTTMDRGVNYFTFNQVPASIYTAGAVYYVRVAVMTANTWSPFGDACEITAPGGLAKGETTVAETTTVNFKATAYPNPYASSFAIELNGASQEDVNVKVYDMLGKLLENRNIPAASMSAEQVGAQFPAGVYNVIVNQAGNLRTLRVVKR